MNPVRALLRTTLLVGSLSAVLLCSVAGGTPTTNEPRTADAAMRAADRYAECYAAGDADTYWHGMTAAARDRYPLHLMQHTLATRERRVTAHAVRAEPDPLDSHTVVVELRTDEQQTVSVTMRYERGRWQWEPTIALDDRV